MKVQLSLPCVTNETNNISELTPNKVSLRLYFSISNIIATTGPAVLCVCLILSDRRPYNVTNQLIVKPTVFEGT